MGEFDIPVLFHVTVTPYKDDIELNVIPKGILIEAIKRLSRIIGIDNLTIRYDPVFLSDKYDLNYHVKAFDNLCCLLDGYVNRILISFLDEYKNVKKNKGDLNYRAFNKSDYKVIGESFSRSAREHNVRVFTCFESEDLVEYGFVKDECLSHELAFKLTGKTYDRSRIRKGKKCNCVKMVDIGAYNSCLHLCKYCYANYDEDKVLDNFKCHDVDSSLLIGNLCEDDDIKERVC